MFRMDRNSNHQQAANETANNQPPPGPHNAPAYDALYQTSPPSTVSRAISESEALARDIKEGILTGFVGNGTVLTGEATFRGMLRIDGHLSGSIRSHDGTLLVGAGGQVDASIEVAVATIHGTVNGDIIATKRIEIGRTSRVVGNIQTPTLVIEQGAIFEGNCCMLRPKEAADKQREKEIHEADSSLLEASEPADLSNDLAIPS